MKGFLRLLIIILISLCSISIPNLEVFALDGYAENSLTINNNIFEIYVNTEPKLVTRAELCKFLVKALNLKPLSISLNYSDLSRDNDYYQYISAIVNERLLLGYSDGTFRPDGLITRAEYAVLLSRALKYETPNTEIFVEDVTNNHWAQSYINTVLDAGLMSLDENNNFRPNDYLCIDFSGQILPIISPQNVKNKKVIWKSNNDDIAAVDETGHVTGRSPGFAVITCSLADGTISKKCYIRIKTSQYTPPLFSGYISPNINTISSNFQIFIGSSDIPISTDENGYFEVNGPLSDIIFPSTIKIVRAGYLTRFVNIDNYGQISTKNNPLEMWSGDINSDSCINMSDIVLIAKCFNTTAGQNNFNRNCDLNLDGVINMTDVMCVAKRFGSNSENY